MLNEIARLPLHTFIVYKQVQMESVELETATRFIGICDTLIYIPHQIDFILICFLYGSMIRALSTANYKQYLNNKVANKTLK